MNAILLPLMNVILLAEAMTWPEVANNAVICVMAIATSYFLFRIIKQ